MTGTTIQKYMDFTKFANLILSRKLYLSKMSGFEDKLEGSLTVKDFLETANSPRLLDITMTDAWPGIGETVEERNLRLARIEEQIKAISRREFETPFGRYSCDEAEKVFSACQEWLYVSCWHQSEHECSAMWNLYGNNKNSICIFSTVEKLKSALTTNDRCDHIQIEKINYINHATDEFSTPLAPFISKSIAFSFEKELRVVAWNSKTELLKNPKNESSGIAIDIKPEKLIEKITISPHADGWFKDTIENLCNLASPELIIENSSLSNRPVNCLYSAMENLKP